MMRKPLTHFINLPFTQFSETTERNSKTKISTFSKIIIDVLDDDLWGSKISFIGNSIIIIAILTSTLDYIFSYGHNGLTTNNSIIEFTLTSFFITEFLLRLIYAKPLGFPPLAQLSYVFSFLGIIDFLSLIPIILDLFNVEFLSIIGTLRILRLWRVVRFIPSFKVITNAFNSRKEDIITSLLGIILLSLTLSALMFHFENDYKENSFKNIFDVFIWSLGKYTGDYGSIALRNPISDMGKVIATINGLLGIALFALPAGLLASAFIEQLEEKRKKEIINSRIKAIETYFKKKIGGGKHFKYDAFPRFGSIDYIQSKFLLSEVELFECIREATNLRFRALKSSPEKTVSDIRIIESFQTNCNYGFRRFNDESKIVLVNAIGHNERGISHFSFTLAQGLKTNFLAREKELTNSQGASIGGNASKEYERYQQEDKSNFNPDLLEFLQDIESFDENVFFVILSSGASGRKDITLEYGNVVNSVEWDSSITTINSSAELKRIRDIFNEELSNVQFTGPNQATITHNFTLDYNTIGINKANSLHRFIHNSTKANVLSIYINIRILTGEDNLYYCAASALGSALERMNVPTD